MKTKEEIIERLNLWPVVPIIDYDDYRCSWSDKSENQVLLKNYQELKNYIPPKNKRITGYYIYTGEKSNIIVIDLDIGHKSDVNGISNFNDIITNLPIEDQKIINNTLTVLTKRNGIHLYFKYNSEINKKVSFDGIDIITNGCLAPVPGSKRRIDPPGNKKIGTYELLFDYPIQPMPQSLIEVIKQYYVKPKEKSKRGRPKEISKYYNPSQEGSRDNTLISWLGHIVKFNPNLRKKDELLPLAEMYNLRYLNPPLENNIVNDKVDSILKMVDPPYIDEKGKIIPYKLSEFIAQKYTIVSDDINAYIYKDNYYQELNNNCYKEIDSLVNNKSLIKMQMVNEVFQQVKMQTNIYDLTNGASKVIENQRGYINFKNGLYDVENRKLIKHSKNIISLYQVNCLYDEDKSDINGTNFERFLNTSICPEDIPIIQEMIGLCLYPLTNKIAYFYILTGNGRNGKGVLLDIIQAIIPKRSISHISLEDIDIKFTNSALKGKCLNICSDDPTKYIDKTGALKRFTNGEPVDIEHKCKDPITIQPYITIISAMNELPTITDKSQGLYDRLVMIPFNKSFGTKEEVDNGLKDMVRDPLLKQKIIKSELPNVIAWGMIGLKRIINNNYKLTTSKHSDKAKNEYRGNNDSIYAFINNCIDRTPGSTINATILYETYRLYCQNENLLASNQTKFGKELKKYNIKKQKVRDGLIYIDIKLKVKDFITEEIQPKESVCNDGATMTWNTSNIIKL